jgi:hypothetical protein
MLFAGAALAQTGAGWIDLPTDEKLTGWVRVSVPPTQPLKDPNQWKGDPAARTILCEGNGGHEMLRYDREFGDFLFHAEWRFTKLPDENAKYNSGVYVRNNADGTIWHQAQAGFSGVWLFGTTLVDGKPGRLNLKPQATGNPLKPIGEWNVYDITCQGPNITLTVNGQLVNEFKTAEVKKGYVAIEAEGYRIEFRNLRIKPL